MEESAGLSVGLLVLKMTRQHTATQRRASTPAMLVLAPPPAPTALRMRPPQDASGPADTGPDPRVLRDASVIVRNASAQGQRLSQRTLARELRGHGHHFPNDHLRLIAESVGLSCGTAA